MVWFPFLQEMEEVSCDLKMLIQPKLIILLPQQSPLDQPNKIRFGADSSIGVSNITRADQFQFEAINAACRV